MTAPNAPDVGMLRELLAKATRGPWESADGVVRPAPESPDRVTVAYCSGEGSPQGEADADCIAAMRNALPDLIAEITRLRAIAEAVEPLRAFAQDVMDSWPEGAPDGGDVQEYATKHGLLREVLMPEPCGAECACLEYLWVDDFPTACYRKTTLLTGKPENDAAIDRLLAIGEDG